MTQETIKKDAEEYYVNNIFCDGITEFEHDIAIRCYIAGAKNQQERMFALVQEYNQMLIDPNVHEDHKEKSFKEWFEQFKKK